MTYTSPAAYLDTSLKAFYDFGDSYLYKDISPTGVFVQNYIDPELDEEGNRIPVPDNSFSSNKTISVEPEILNHSVEIIQEFGVDVEPSFINTGFFIGDTSNITGHFNGRYSSLGANFESTAILIHKSRNFNPKQTSYILSHTKVSQGTEILFSCLNKNQNSGFEIGINDANKLYIEYPESYGTQTVTLNTINDNKNIYFLDVDLENNKAVLGRWDGFQEEIEEKAFYYQLCDCFKSTGMDWVIGSGVYRGEEGINFQDYPYKCTSFIDKFACFDGFLSRANKKDFVKSFYESLQYIPRVYEEYQGGIIGYNNVIDYTVSGIVEYQDVITGYKSYNVDYTSETYTELIGTVQKGESYYEYDSDFENNLKTGEENASGLYIAYTATEEIENVITGFEIGFTGASYVWSDQGVGAEPLYYHSGVSGKLYDVYRSEPIYADSREIIKERGSYIMSGEYPLQFPDGENGYGPTRYTFLGARDERDDYLEHYQGVNMFSINNFADIEVFNKFTPEAAISLSSDVEYEYKHISLYINGVSQTAGDLEFVNDGCNITQDKWDLTSGDFGIYEWPENNLDIGINKIYYNDQNISLLVDHPLIDIVSEQPGTGHYATFEQYSNSELFNLIVPGGSDKVFFNGQKLVEGKDYYFDSQDRFNLSNPSNFFEGVAGYFSIEKDFILDDDNLIFDKVRGTAVFDIANGSPCVPGSNVTYMNGIRLDPKAYIYHGDYDLITQNKSFIMETESNTVYNTSATYADTTPREMHLFEIPEFGPVWLLDNSVDEYGNIVDQYGNVKIPMDRRSFDRNEQFDLLIPSKKVVELSFEDQ